MFCYRGTRRLPTIPPSYTCRPLRAWFPSLVPQVPPFLRPTRNAIYCRARVPLLHCSHCSHSPRGPAVAHPSFAPNIRTARARRVPTRTLRPSEGGGGGGVVWGAACRRRDENAARSRAKLSRSTNPGKRTDALPRARATLPARLWMHQPPAAVRCHSAVRARCTTSCLVRPSPPPQAAAMSLAPQPAHHRRRSDYTVVGCPPCAREAADVLEGGKKGRRQRAAD